jgi:hypothetical protein
MSANTTDGAQKLAYVFKPLLEAALKELEGKIKEHTTAINQEVLIKLGTLEGRIDVLEKIVADNKKAKSTREKKTSAANADAGAAAVDGTVAETTTKETKKADTPQFPINKLVWFRDEFKASEEFRNKYITPAYKAAMDGDAKISDKKGDQKYIAQAQYVWSKLKLEAKDKIEEIEKAYKDAEVAFNEANKPKQQVAEPEPAK